MPAVRVRIPHIVESHEKMYRSLAKHNKHLENYAESRIFTWNVCWALNVCWAFTPAQSRLCLATFEIRKFSLFFVLAPLIGVVCEGLYKNSWRNKLGAAAVKAASPPGHTFLSPLFFSILTPPLRTVRLCRPDRHKWRPNRDR